MAEIADILPCTIGRSFRELHRDLIVKSGVRTLYNILFTVALSCPRRITSCECGGAAIGRRASAERFGRYDTKLKQAITNRHTLWMHAVSVGEVNVCTQLIRALEPRLPNLKIVVSTTTTTGMGEVAAQAADPHQQDLLSD